jgi:hypothetical protein
MIITVMDRPAVDVAQWLQCSTTKIRSEMLWFEFCEPPASVRAALRPAMNS